MVNTVSYTLPAGGRHNYTISIYFGDAMKDTLYKSFLLYPYCLFALDCHLPLTKLSVD